jgi:hypothetical protein
LEAFNFLKKIWKNTFMRHQTNTNRELEKQNFRKLWLSVDVHGVALCAKTSKISTFFDNFLTFLVETEYILADGAKLSKFLLNILKILKNWTTKILKI